MDYCANRGGVHLGYSTNTVEILVCPVVEELGETHVQVERVVDAVLGEAVAESVVGEGTRSKRSAHGGQLIGGVVGVGVFPVVQEVAVVVPRVSDAVYAGQPIGVVIQIGGLKRQVLLSQWATGLKWLSIPKIIIPCKPFINCISNRFITLVAKGYRYKRQEA